jgi:hypothetical protein
VDANLRGVTVPGPVSARFLASDAKVVAIEGPMLAGRKTTAWLKILARPFQSQEQQRWRWIAVAPSADYLDRHVKPQLRELIGEVGQWSTTGVPGVRVPLTAAGRTFTEVEIVFLGLDSRDHRARLANYDTTGVLIVDARHIDESVFDDALEIIDTYPPEGTGPARGSLIVVSRMPQLGHWTLTRPEIEMHRQPGGRSAGAENLSGLARRGISYAALAQRLHPERVRVEIDAEFAGTGAEADAEAARRAAQEDFTRFIAIVMPDIQPAEHHRLLIDKLEAVARGEIKRLMIFLPPGSAKSTYASILFPPWYMGRNPSHPVIAASHAKELAERFGRRVRNIVGSTVYKEIFGFGLSGDSPNPKISL